MPTGCFDERVFMKEFKCRICHVVCTGTSPAVLRTHYAEAHPGVRSPVYKPRVPAIASVTSSYNKILDAEKIIREEVKNLEFERDQKMNEIRLLDDKIAKYKKMV